jgi:branched-chain amino acid transport system permease protein
MTSELLVQYLLSGITIGSVYAIVAIGFNIIYNATGIINFAQGEFVMLGGMIAISCMPFMPLCLAVSCAVIATALIGVLLYVCFFRWLKSPSVLRLIIITIGLSILIREAALMIWGEQVRSLPYFTGNEISSIRIFRAYISPQVLWILGIAGIMVLLLNLFFAFTRMGRAMRACSSNPSAATLCGINSQGMVAIAFMLSAAIGALAGCVMSPMTQTQYDSGTPLAVKGFTVAILGGLGNSTAAAAAGLLLGIIEALVVSILPVAYKDVIAIGLLLVVLAIRPTGLFTSRQAGTLKDF